MHRRIFPRVRIIGKIRLNTIEINWHFNNGFKDLAWVDFKSFSPCGDLMSSKETLNKSGWAALFGRERKLGKLATVDFQEDCAGR